MLAGGLSSRMGGNDKSLAMLRGEPLMAHVLRSLERQAQAIAINANGDPARFAAFGKLVLADTVSGHPGPLAGLLAGMEWVEGLGYRHFVSTPADAPFLPQDLVAALAHTVEPNQDRPILAVSNGRRHPVVGLWPVRLAEPLRTFLATGETYKVSVFADRHGAATVDFPMIKLKNRTVDPFFNVNTSADLAEAEAILKEWQS